MSCSNVQTPILSCVDGQNTVPAPECHQGLSKFEDDKKEIEKDQDEEEDEDVDFNPFLKETPSREASSSLSSEIDVFGGDMADSGVVVGTKISKVTNMADVSDGENSERGEELIVLQTSSPYKASKKGKEEHVASNIKATGICQEEGNKFHGNLDLDDAITKESGNAAKSRKPVIEIDNEDAICTRTRARYSLASFTLDELETFLQESDDDDDLQNVDDEEEYRKFLASVLLDGGDDNRSTQVNENVDDDEDNDADFEIELEELLESDIDESAPVKTPLEYSRAARRPQTRQNRRQRGSSQSEKKLYGHVNKPLRPLLPSVPNQWTVHGKSMVAEAAFLHPSFTSENSADDNGIINGFTPQQIGQLYILIHEHVQLLIQVFSLCAIDSSRQHIASQVRGLMFEILHKRDEVLTSKGVSYPSNCFSPLFLCSSVSDGSSKCVQTECNSEIFNTSNTPIGQSSQIPCKGRSEHDYIRQGNIFLNVEGSFWVPFMRGPVDSVLDVAPLDLVAKYVDDVYNASLEHRKRYLECNSDTRIKEEPLFPLPSLSSGVAANSEGACGSVSHVIHTSTTTPSHPPPKKTMAAVLVENTKKQSIALVPKEVAKLAQRFFPLFNPALFPHKPPPTAAVQRILFTDSEDELLALGLMEYNNDWKAIQKRFLPCKSTHQIFVRQKNRASSKAPENAIKAVRRMKTSPLTVEEMARIQEGLVVYKFDWMSIWKYIVPYRDASLLPRLWRIANGTQKSYKLNAAQKEQRRLYESKRRKCQLATSEHGDIISVREGHQANKDGREGGGRDVYIDNPEVAYVHQAFLADWRPAASTLNSTCPYLGSREETPVVGSLQQGEVRIREQQNHLVSGQAPPQSSCTPPFPSGIRREHISSSSLTSNMVSGKCSFPNRSRRVNNTRWVRLAPNLAPVNLPRSVRVVSQAAFKGNQHSKSARVCSTGNSADARNDTYGPQNRLGEKLGAAHLVEVAKDNLQGSVKGSQLDKIDAEGDSACDFQMHPLLFRAPQNGNAPVHFWKFCSSTSDTPRTQPQLSLTLFPDPHQRNHTINCDEDSRKFKSKDSSPKSCGIDFHPLLQKATDTQSRTTYHTFQTKTLVSNDGVSMAKRSTGTSENPKEVDLEMTLSSRFGKERAVSNLPSDAHPSAISSDNIRCNIDDICDQSQIVMEQEELSDSDEDIEENVEFECEEMADSEGEEVSGSDQSTEGQNKVLSNSTIEVQKHDAGGGIQSEARADSNTHVDAHLPHNVSSQSMVMTRQRKERSQKLSWLSLDSHVPEFPSSSNTMHEGVSTDQDPSGNLSTTPSSKSSKKLKISSKGVQEKHALITAEQISPDPVAFPMSGRSKKRRGKEE